MTLLTHIIWFYSIPFNIYIITFADELIARSRCDITISLLIVGVLGHSTIVLSSFLCSKVTFWMFVLFRHNDKVELVVSAHRRSSMRLD